MYLIPFLSIFLGWVIQGFLGIGSGIIATAILMFFFNAKSVVVSLSILAFVGTVFLAVKNYQGKLFLETVIPISFFSFVGVFIGSHFLEEVNKNLLEIFFGVIIVLTGVYDLLLRNKVKFSKNKTKLLLIVTGISGGLISGLIGGAGPIYAFFLNQTLTSKKAYKFIISFIFTLLNLERVVLYLFSEKLKGYFLPEIIIPGFIGTILGVFLGDFLSKSVPSHTFKKLVSLTIIISGFYFIFTGFSSF